jgi:hypothetical protein
MKMKNVIIVAVVIVIIVIFLRIGYLIAPGSYPKSENYIINTSQIGLLSKIDSLKSHNPHYNIPSLVNAYDTTKHSYNIYIYNYSKDQIIHIEIQPKGNNQSTIHFIGINQGLTLGNWKIINKDFSNKENEFILSDFEKSILNPLGIVYKRE